MESIICYLVQSSPYLIFQSIINKIRSTSVHFFIFILFEVYISFPIYKSFFSLNKTLYTNTKVILFVFFLYMRCTHSTWKISNLTNSFFFCYTWCILFLYIFLWDMFSIPEQNIVKINFFIKKTVSIFQKIKRKKKKCNVWCESFLIYLNFYLNQFF